MRRLFYLFFAICILGIAPETGATGKRAPAPPPGPLLMYDRGTTAGRRPFQSADGCAIKPCIVQQHGAWRFAPEVVQAYRVTMGFLRGDHLLPIALFQESTSLEQRLGERLLNRYPNRKVVNLLRMVETGAVPIIYMYGILLQYDVHEGDPILVTLTGLTDLADTHEYYFRYHRAGAVPDIDLALAFPLGFFHPNPGNMVQGAAAGVAFAFSVGTNMDPEKRYGWARKLLRAARFNMVAGILTRKELTPIGGDLVVRDVVDGFGGLGLTFFDFLTAGYGINFVRSPHTTFPFVGIEIRHVFEFLHSLKSDTHTRWEKYLEGEKGRPASAPPPAPGG